MDLQPGMRVLDLGAGKALSSVFLAREFDVTVFAVDLLVPAAESWERIVAAGATDRVVPLPGDARSLPFADGYFDAIVSIGAYPYFGTDDLYLGSCLRCLRPGGQIAMIGPGLREELHGAV